MRKEIDFFDVYHETLDKLGSEGILLVAGDPPNPMTIGWGTMGTIWQRKIMTVMVRPTRFTFGKMESITDFTVCVMPDGRKADLDLCGTRSGRDTDKVTECGFHMKKGVNTNSFYIAESAYHYECRVVHRQLLNPFRLDSAIIDRFYPLRDFHMVYYGEIRGIFRHE